MLSPQEIVQLATTLLMALIAVGTFIIGRVTAERKTGKTDGQMLSDVGYVKSGIDDIKRKQEQQEEKEELHHLEVMTRLSSVEESAKSAHKRIDRLEKKNWE